MKHARLGSVVALAFFACSACNSKQKEAENPSGEPDTLSLQGIYTFGETFHSFRECGDDSTVYRLNDPDHLLTTQAAEFAFFPSDQHAVFVELEAVEVPLTQEANQASVQYDGTLQVVSVLNMTSKNFRTVCFPYDFWCLGNEPFWSVEISGGEHLIRYTDLGTESAYSYAYTEPVIEGNRYTYVVPEESGQPPLRIVVTEENCSDGMSDRTYDYSVRVEAGERQLSGCAIAGTNLADL